jgi:nucleotide-binding universal stress UspA family protein
MTVVVAIRIGAGSRPAVEAAARLAQQLGAELRLLYIAMELEAVPELASAAGQSEQDVRQRMIDEINERCRAELGDPFPGDAELVIREGKVAETVARTAAELRAEFIVVGMKGRSALAKLVLGDTTGAILERAPCPVVVIPPAVLNGESASPVPGTR